MRLSHICKLYTFAHIYTFMVYVCPYIRISYTYARTRISREDHPRRAQPPDPIHVYRTYMPIYTYVVYIYIYKYVIYIYAHIHVCRIHGHMYIVYICPYTSTASRSSTPSATTRRCPLFISIALPLSLSLFTSHLALSLYPRLHSLTLDLSVSVCLVCLSLPLSHGPPPLPIIWQLVEGGMGGAW